MERKKIIFIMGIVALVLFAISGSGLILETVYRISLEKREAILRNERVAQVTDYYQKYLDQTARKITELPANQNTISEIQSAIYKNSSNVIAYLWLSDKKGDFIFGVPSFVFARLNTEYDKGRIEIEKEKSYVDRNDFLLKSLNRDSSELSSDSQYSHYFFGALETFEPLVFSSPVIGNDRQIIGDIYIKLFDAHHGSSYNRFLSTIIFPACEGALAISGIFLWFLIPSWVYIDARQRDVKRAFMWALLTVISSLFGLMIYLITRPVGFKTFHCPKCQGELNGTKAFCPHCGMDLSSVFCPQCQYPVKPEWQYCPNCRFDMRQKPQDEAPNPEEQPQEAEQPYRTE